ncbi:PepSY-associated TM helix domain-containing protein [Idiomarina fontislapidosi]|uniref:PepSY domain-containing protein n=1 Tax=Idiomarina fontislapidosi TaxID=263723 RepID=A0A432XP29_9GAMM|nr:PepSY-associated TM helix domain-containing protein [Idiomarina fontislapidosi]RUO50447.1 PepSY domain-containing protein [Idiomarina fontislapidosi]
MKRIKLPSLTQWHRWLGLVLSGWVLLMAVTGSMLLFKNQWLMWQYPNLRLETPVSHTTSATIADRYKAGYAYLPTHDRPWFELVDGDGNHHYFGLQGEHLLTRAPYSDTVSWFVELHHHLALDKFGKDILGVLSLFALVLIITGLVRWWPKRQWRWKNLAIRFYNPFSAKGMQTLWQLHRSTGAIVFIPIALLMFTGSAIMYASTVKDGLTTLLPMTDSRIQHTVPDRLATHWQERFEIARAVLPNADIRLIYLDSGRMRLKWPDEWHPNGRNYIAFDDRGTLTTITDVRARPLGEQIAHMVYPLHVAAIGGTAMTLVILAGGIALLLLPVTGVWFYLKRRNKR